MGCLFGWGVSMGWEYSDRDNLLLCQYLPIQNGPRIEVLGKHIQGSHHFQGDPAVGTQEGQVWPVLKLLEERGVVRSKSPKVKSERGGV